MSLPTFAKHLRSLTVVIFPAVLFSTILFLGLLTHALDGPSAPSGPAQGQVAPAPSLEAPVIVSGKTLFSVQRLLSLPAPARADAIRNRIQRLAKDISVNRSSLKVLASDVSTDIVAGDTIVMSITDKDAAAAGKTRNQVAQENAAIIASAIEALRREYSARSILFGVLYTVLATIILFLALHGLRRAFRKVYALLRVWHGIRIRSLTLHKFELLPVDRITGLLIGAAKLMRVVVTALLCYLYLSFVLEFFPWTRGYAAILFEYMMTPVKALAAAVLSYLPNIFFIAAIAGMAFYCSRFVKIIFREVGKGTIEFPGFYPEWADPTYAMVRFLIMALTAIVVFPYLPGAQSPAFQGVSIFLGVLFSLGSTSAVANVVAGVILTYMRAFTIGDRVQIADTVGDVIEKTLLVTRVRTVKNVDVTIANSMVLGAHIVNFNASAKGRGLILHTGVTIGYDAPWRKVHELLLRAAAATEHILKEPKPFVLQTALNDSSAHYELNAYTDQPNEMAWIYSHLHQNIQDSFREAQVDIVSSGSPRLVAHHI